MGLFLPELGYPEAFGRPAVMDWDRNLDFSAGLGQLKETRGHLHFLKEIAIMRISLESL